MRAGRRDWRRLQLLAPGDHDKGTNFQAQLDITDVLNAVLSVTNKGYFESYSQQQYEYAQRYYNNIKDSYNFEDRLELHAKTSGNELIGGVAYRLIHVLAYGDSMSEATSRRLKMPIPTPQWISVRIILTLLQVTIRPLSARCRA